MREPAVIDPRFADEQRLEILELLQPSEAGAGDPRSGEPDLLEVGHLLQVLETRVGDGRAAEVDPLDARNVADQLERAVVDLGAGKDDDPPAGFIVAGEERPTAPGRRSRRENRQWDSGSWRRLVLETEEVPKPTGPSGGNPANLQYSTARGAGKHLRPSQILTSAAECRPSALAFRYALSFGRCLLPVWGEMPPIGVHWRRSPSAARPGEGPVRGLSTIQAGSTADHEAPVGSADERRIPDRHPAVAIALAGRRHCLRSFSAGGVDVWLFGAVLLAAASAALSLTRFAKESAVVLLLGVVCLGGAAPPGLVGRGRQRSVTLRLGRAAAGPRGRHTARPA